MGVAAAQQSSRAAGSIVLRHQGPVAEGDPAASPVEGRVERSSKVAPYRAILVEIFAGRRHNRRLLCVEGGNLQNNQFPRYIVFKPRRGLLVVDENICNLQKTYSFLFPGLDPPVVLLERPQRGGFSGAERVPTGKVGQDEGAQFVSGREELACHSALRDGREELRRSQTRGNAAVPHVGAGQMLVQQIQFISPMQFCVISFFFSL